MVRYRGASCSSSLKFQFGGRRRRMERLGGTGGARPEHRPDKGQRGRCTRRQGISRRCPSEYRTRVRARARTRTRAHTRTSTGTRTPIHTVFAPAALPFHSLPFHSFPFPYVRSIPFHSMPYPFVSPHQQFLFLYVSIYFPLLHPAFDTPSIPIRSDPILHPLLLLTLTKFHTIRMQDMEENEVCFTS